jgi:pimeloyl-ACP methyl ester carboxylesterase
VPTFTNGDTTINYAERGSGFPLLLIAPGGVRSSIEFWDNAPWNPIDQLGEHYRVIAMDQRNAGASTGPVTADSSWSTYTNDQLALLDHLGVDRFLVQGMCIGGSYIVGLIQAAPERVVAAVLMQPIGLDHNRDAFHEMFDMWAAEQRAAHPEAGPTDWERFREAMFGGDFLFNATPEFVSSCPTPMLVLMGNDRYHPESVSRRVADLAPNATLIENWKDPDDQPAARLAIEEFLAAHTPPGAV